MKKNLFIQKILIIAIILIMALEMNCFAANKTGKASQGLKLGDVDNYGKVTTADSILVLRYSVGLETFNAEQIKAADFNKDGKVTSADARLILREAAGLGSDVEVTTVTMTADKSIINVGDTITIKANVSPSNATNKNITYSSSNTSVANVSSNGTVKGISGGTANITAKSSNGKTATCKIEVLDGKIRLKNGNVIDTSKPILIGHKYTNLSENQIKRLAWIAKREQGSIEGAKVELSLMANLTESRRSDYNIYNCVMYSGWFGNTSSVPSNPQYNREFTEEYVKVAKEVLVEGKRYLPTNVVEHDYIGDISRLSTGGSKWTRSNYIPYQTTISNIYGARYVFVGFAPNGGDPFGYLVK